ncbi:MAG: ribosome small subunit-dependent GTPase A [Spirochaetales bacterium]|nr:ribosome small subunit-dependent GTPase A [Spirochaetales bacterium]
MENLIDLGWQRSRSKELLSFPECQPARIVSISGSRFLAMSGSGPVSGPLNYAAGPPSTWLAVGDWVALTPENRIASVLSRTSLLARKVVGEPMQEQLLAANVDYAFVLQGLDGDFNPRRLERTIALIHAGKVVPVVVLTKEDRAPALDDALARARAVLPGIVLFSICVLEGRGVDRVAGILGPGITGVFLGSSGAGKSTLLNALLGATVQKTAAVRAHDSRGRHTTSARKLFFLPGGGMVIDTPGMRELQLWDAEEGVSETFPEIEETGKHCRFRNCRHENEPGCAVLLAVDGNELSRERLLSYVKLRREAEAFALRQKLHGRDSAEARRIGRAIKSVAERKRPRVHYE